jgi:type IV pilus assembly protein PilB
MTLSELEDRLAELLTAYHLLEPSSLDHAQSFRSVKRCTLAGALAALHLVTDETIGRLLEEVTGVRAVDPSLLGVHQDFVEAMNVLLPPALVCRLVIFPAQMETNTIHICTLNPCDGWTVRALEAVSGCRVAPLVAHESAIIAALERHYGRPAGDPASYARGDGERDAEAVYRSLLNQPFAEFADPAVAVINRQHDLMTRDPRVLESLARNPLVIRVVQQILCRAIEAGASDIHFEPAADSLRVRLRVDGVMRVAHVLQGTMAKTIVARIKAMAGVSLQPAAEPLDGRIAQDIVWGRGIDLRFSLVPSIAGEKVVLRVLDRTRERRGLSDLGMDARCQMAVETASDLPNGLLLVTGPTGSGKSATLYALLDRLNDESACVLTAEDPVESRLVGVTQVPCDEASGVTFASALRSFLRQDPDIMMVGEIRDEETADIALKAALTGHLVLSTLHTNDASSAVLRLLNMHADPFVIASTLRVVVAQRLIRTLCRVCKLAVTDSKKMRALLDVSAPRIRATLQSGRLFEAVGCPKCGGSGYRGRTGIFEVLRVTDRISELITGRGTAAELRAAARAEGMWTLREAGLRKVAAGETSISEVWEHTMADESEASVMSVSNHV